jgi:hypothetical protein
MQREFANRMWLVMVASLLALSGAANQTTPNTKAKPMTPIDLDRLMQTKNWSAVQLATQSGPSIVPALDPYLRSPDEVVRLLAVDCLGAAGGPQAARFLIGALADPNEQVRNDAVNGLHNHLPAGHEGELLAAWDANRTRDTYVRQQIPMILGLLRASTRISDLKARLSADPRQDVKDGIIAGLAKLGDVPSRATFGAMLRDARGKRAAELIELVKYLDEARAITYHGRRSAFRSIPSGSIKTLRLRKLFDTRELRNEGNRTSPELTVLRHIHCKLPRRRKLNHSTPHAHQL